MFDVGSIVYFKNPSHYGAIENTDIGWRWCSAKGCDVMHTAPLFAATAGIIKSKFEVVNAGVEGVSDPKLVTVRSVDKHDLWAIVVPEFLIPNSNTSSILNNNEKRLLLYLHALSEGVAQATLTDKAVKEEVTENPDVPANKKQDNGNTHDCTNCGKCSNKQPGHRNITKDLKNRADQWEKLFSGGSCRREEAVDEEPDTDIDELIGELVDTVCSEIVRRIEDKKAEEKLKSFRNQYGYEPFYWVREIPSKRQTSRGVPRTLDELIGEFFW